MVAFNKRLLEEAGLESPYELIEKDEWNFAKLQEYAKALTKTDANGVTTQYGFSAYDPYGTLATTFVNANNAGIVEEVMEKPPLPWIPQCTGSAERDVRHVKRGQVHIPV